jgi:hypothetical protein
MLKASDVDLRKKLPGGKKTISPILKNDSFNKSKINVNRSIDDS